MGNTLECLPQTCSPARAAGSSRPAKLVNGVTGEVQQVALLAEEPVKVAEVMLDNPSAFVMALCNPAQPASFFIPLPADHQLQPGHLYLLLPMHKLHKRASPQDLSFFARLGDEAAGRQRQALALSPAGCFIGGRHQVRAGDDLARNIELAASTPCHSEAAPFLVSTPPSTPRSRSWKPTLHTISEAPPPSAGNFSKQLTRLLSKGSPHGHVVQTMVPTC